jgi:hypothetical protein
MLRAVDLMRAPADAARVTAGAIEVVSRPAIEVPPLEWAGPPSLGHAIILAIAAACPALVKCPSVSSVVQRVPVVGLHLTGVKGEKPKSSGELRSINLLPHVHRRRPRDR